MTADDSAIGLGLIGLGRLGRVRAEIAGRQLPNGRLAAVFDIDTELASTVAAEYGAAAVGSVEELVNHGEVDGVIVCTPTHLHVDPVTIVAAADKPLFCEKPLASTMDDTLQLVETIDATGIACHIGFNRRHDPDHLRARDFITSGAIGTPTYLRSNIRDPFPPPPWALNPNTGGGLFMDMLIHDIDAARMLMGEEIASVYASTANLVVDPEGIDGFADNATVSFTFTNGALGQFHGSVHARYGYDVRAEVFGSDGNIEIGRLNQHDVTLMTESGGLTQPWTFQTRDGIPHAMFRFADAYRDEIIAFADTVANGTPPTVDHHDALAAFRVAYACQRSATEGRPVDLTELH
ncbi:MAG: Gfo/Idh/MocA family oxidoreductase [Acidimicrobiia bacterium]|nr:Gfo/Idh/MocA family oxidoreductase [Acidimicrobiia bacterium]